jgi:hypothetical protein
LVKKAQGTHKCAKESVKLTTLDRNELEYDTEPVVTTNGATNRVKLNQWDASQGSEVPTINEFSYVLPEELSIMLPDRDIKFVIDLKPSTAPIYKNPYRMTAKHLVELKEHIKELLEKGYIHPSSPPLGASMIFIPEKDGTQGMYVYYRTQNEVAIKNKYPLPRTDGLFDQLHGVCVCSLRLIFDRDRISGRDENVTS